MGRTQFNIRRKIEMATRIQFSMNELDFIRETLGNVMPDLIYDDGSYMLSKKELIKLAKKLNIEHDERR
jgi:hypothetical protein